MCVEVQDGLYRKEEMNSIEEIVLSVVKEMGDEQEKEELQAPDSTTMLFGKSLDSMGIVLLVTEIEEEIFNVFGLQVSLADERAMSQKTSPFRSVKTLVKYVETLVDEENSAE
jgi:acyl carrier protein